jgi:hypothetical protein
MNHVKRFSEIFENIAVHKNVRPEKLPKIADMEAKGYRIAQLSDGNKYAFTKNFDEYDDVYWLGVNNQEYKYGDKISATANIVKNKKGYAFYAIYSKCDTSPTDDQKKAIAERQRDIEKKQKELQKQIRGKNKEKRKKE